MSYLARLITPRCIVRTAITMMATLGLLGAGSVLAQSTAGNALTGQGLFDANCKACHGQTHPAAGTLNVQKANTAAALQAAITTTSPTMQGVPNLQGLSSVQLADIAAYVAADVNASANGNIANGQRVYASSCQACHGPVPASGNARVSLGISAAVIQNAITRFPSAMGPFATFGPLRFNWTQTELDDVAAFIAQDVAAGTPSTGVDRGQPMYTAMCSSCHGGAARGGERMVKATHPEKTLSAIASDQGGMGSLSFMTHEQATDIAIYIGAAGPTGGLKGYLEGGCTLGRSDAPMDPIWLLMLLGATGTLELRRRGRV